MRLWLIEYKSFLPQHLQEMSEKKTEKKKTIKKNKDGSKVAPLDKMRKGSIDSKTSKKSKNKKGADEKTETRSIQHSVVSSKKGKDIKTNFQVCYSLFVLLSRFLNLFQIEDWFQWTIHFMYFIQSNQL